MKVYIAYKFTNIEEKEAIKAKLEFISKVLTEMGHEAYILGRDYKKWKHVNISKVLPNILAKLGKRDMILAYINSEAKSQGLMFETIIAKLMGKKRILVIKPGIKAKFFRKNFKTVIELEDLEGLREKLEETELGTPKN